MQNLQGYSISAKFLQEIGRITVNFAFLEAAVSFFISGLISDDQTVGQIVTAELSFKNRIALLSSVVRHTSKDSEIVRRLDALLMRALHVEEKRNKVTHSVWGSCKTPDTITRVKFTAKVKKGLKSQFEAITVAELSTISKEISDLSGEILRLWFSQTKIGAHQAGKKK